ncbi:MAG: hypothetical protein QOF73_1974 [Thermomicrobiales bacterium]|nr:hypothetical protein [Thermomicrobiales bacterium]
MTAQSPTAMTCDDVSDALGAYALGVLDLEESQAVERHLETCPRCAGELVRFERVADSLAVAPPLAPPPLGLRSRLLEETRATPKLAAVASEDVLRRTDRSGVTIPRWVVWPAAAAAVLLIAGIAALAILLAQAREDRDAAVTGRSRMAAYLSAGGQVTKLSEATSDGKYYGHGSLVTARDLPPIIVVGGCSPTEKDRRYRVWVARGDDRTRVGELNVDDDGEGWLELSVNEPLETFDLVGITMITADDQRQDVLVGPIVQTSTA